MSIWSIRIKELESAGWSLKAIGEYIGLSGQSISDIKNGRTKEPGGMAAVRLHQMQGMKPAAADQKAA